MTNYDSIDFTPLVEAVAETEVVTHSYVQDVPLPSGGLLALITLDNGRDHTRPNTLGPGTLLELETVLDEQRSRANRRDISGIAITGKPFILAAGADLSNIGSLRSRDEAKRIAQFGHRVLGKLHDAPVPTFAFINGLALGGGVEVALNADYRTIDAHVPAIAFPEVFLGIIPGWGGTTILPNLIGIENALELIVSNPLKNNRTIDAAKAAKYGIADTIFESVRFLEDSIAWADGVITGKIQVKRKNQPGKLERLAKWDIAIKIARNTLKEKLGTVPKSPYVALDLLKEAKDNNRAKGFAREDEALADLVSGDQFRASIYAFNLVKKRAKKPAGAPDRSLAQPVRKVGVIGAGLMARQFALLFLRRLEVPVIITDIDQGRIDSALAYIHGELDKLHSKGRVDDDQLNRLKASLSGTTDVADFAECDWVIEAVFEEVSIKQKVFASVEPYIAETAILATNTSSLDIAEIASHLEHPERVIGFHFFNPVAVMPLIEVVNVEKSGEPAIATAVEIARKLKKTPVITTNTPGFVVNRLLALVMGEAARAVDEGTPLAVVERALDPIGLPMGPFELIDLVGWKVAAHVQDTMVSAFPDRFYASTNLHALAELNNPLQKSPSGAVTGFSKEALGTITLGSQERTPEQILREVQDRLVAEIRLMLDDHVVVAAEDIDLCMILGAGWPFQAGGVTPYLDRVGASERVAQQNFHEPPIRGVR